MEESIFLLKLHSHFNERFLYDEQRVLRAWKCEDDIHDAFKKAKNQVGILYPVTYQRKILIAYPPRPSNLFPCTPRLPLPIPR